MGYEKAAQCLLQLFNYSSGEDFLENVFGRTMPNGVSYHIGVGNLGLNDAGVQSLMHEDSLEGMRRHSARVRDAYGNNTINFDAFLSCYRENIVAFDERFRDAPLPWSSPDRALTYGKLFVAFAPAGLHIIVALVLICICWCASKFKTAIFASTKCSLQNKLAKPSKPELHLDFLRFRSE